MKKIPIRYLALCGAAFAAQFAAAAIPEPDYAPPAEGQQVVINVPQLRLFLYQDGKLLKSYSIAVGKNTTQTPLGNYAIGPKIFNPTWSVPKSIQAEMAKSGKPVLKSVPPGADNPLGPVFVRMGDPRLGLGIHGTNAPASVPGVRSHGCVRMKSPNALDFAKTVQHGSDVAVIYQLASLNVDDGDDVWLVSYRDPYKLKNLKKNNLFKSMKAWAEAHGKQVDVKRANSVLAKQGNTLICVTCSVGKTKVEGYLRPLAWTSGSGEIVVPKMPMRETVPDTEPDNLPEGSSVEVDAEPETPVLPKPKPLPQGIQEEHLPTDTSDMQ